MAVKQTLNSTGTTYLLSVGICLTQLSQSKRGHRNVKLPKETLKFVELNKGNQHI